MTCHSSMSWSSHYFAWILILFLLLFLLTSYSPPCFSSLTKCLPLHSILTLCISLYECEMARLLHRLLRRLAWIPAEREHKGIRPTDTSVPACSTDTQPAYTTTQTRPKEWDQDSNALSLPITAPSALLHKQIKQCLIHACRYLLIHKHHKKEEIQTCRKWKPWM